MSEPLNSPLRKVPCTVWSRVVGYYRPVENWNEAKRLEFLDRVPYRLENTDRFEQTNTEEA